MRVPRDITIHVRRQIAVRVCLWLLIAATIITVFIVEDDSFKRVDPFSKYSAYVLFAIIPAFPLKLHKYIFDRSYEGTVTESATYEQKERGADLFWTGRILTLTYITIKKDDGNVIKELAYRAKDVSVAIPLYNEGDRVVHVFGTDHLQVTNSKVIPQIRCVVCGCYNSPEDECCYKCAHTVKIK